jgi:hypothetical protein
MSVRSPLPRRSRTSDSQPMASSNSESRSMYLPSLLSEGLFVMLRGSGADMDSDGRGRGLGEGGDGGAAREELEQRACCWARIPALAIEATLNPGGWLGCMGGREERIEGATVMSDAPMQRRFAGGGYSGRRPRAPRHPRNQVVPTHLVHQEIRVLSSPASRGR